VLRFAVAGAPLSTPNPGGSLLGLKRAHELGIQAMELEWVQSVPVNPARMLEIRELAEKLDITLTVHAPYYINLNSPEKPKLMASIKRILDALAMSELAGVRSVCVHAAFNLGLEPDTVYKNVSKAVEMVMEKKAKLFPHVNLALESMGKQTQFGTLDEVLRISKDFGLYPCIDPAYLHARANGKMNTKDEWNDMIDQYEKILGKKSLNYVHFHYSGIAYGEKGEKHHLPLEESDANWKDFLKVLKDRKLGGTVVCESPAMEMDTLLLKQTFEKL
jgi:deoxyribonuclease-4